MTDSRQTENVAPGGTCAADCSVAPDPWPEIKCANNRCPWRGMWSDLPQRAKDTPDNGKKTIPMTVSACPLCGSEEFWQIDQPNTGGKPHERA